VKASKDSSIPKLSVPLGVCLKLVFGNDNKATAIKL